MNKFGEKTIVEIIPWIHDITKQSHADVLEFVNRIPIGSKLFAEFSPRDISNAENIFQRIESIKLHDWFSILNNPAMSAALEVYALCMQRKIQIVPLESEILKKNQTQKVAVAHLLDIDKLPDKYKKPVFDKAKRALIERSRTHARNLYSQLNKNDRLVYALVGGLHAKEVRQSLERIGISVKIAKIRFHGNKPRAQYTDNVVTPSSFGQPF